MNTIFDTAIIGGGIAGLSLSIQLARAGKQVVLFEKEEYPFHKVCGEYISNESVAFLKSLGVHLDELKLPQIRQLRLSSPSGYSIKRPLDIGGTGLSRYVLDTMLFELAIKAGVEVHTNTKVRDVQFTFGLFSIQTQEYQYFAKTTAAAYGKNANIDVLKKHTYKAVNQNELYVAVKHHVRVPFDQAFVEIHNFKGGYCGLSAIEDDQINMSYICLASDLKREGSIQNLEKNVLSKNPFLKNYLNEGSFLFTKPLTISHLHMGLKQTVCDHMLMLGDAAGNIAPLSGNGMSMALQSSLIAYHVMLDFLQDDISRNDMELRYSEHYHTTFSTRIKIARFINNMFGKAGTTDIGILALKPFPFLIDLMSKQIHGQEF